MLRIIDASVGIKWFVVENGRDRALDLLAEIMKAPGKFAVPELFFFELAHVFNRLIPSPTPTQIRLLHQVADFGMHRFSMTTDLLTGIHKFQKLGLSGYDGAYLALAQILKGRWITFDGKAHSKVAHLKISEVL